jgi:hypothetical protein
MNKLQDSMLMMGYSVISVGDRFQSTWTGNGPFTAAFNLFKTKVALVESYRDIQIGEMTGITSDKNIKKLTLIDKIMFVEHRLKSFAATTSNNELAGSINYNASDMKYTSQAEISGIANTLIAKAQANITALAPYGITAPVITDLQTAVTAFNTALPRPRNAMVQRKNATENINLLFAEINSILKDRLDHDIEVFKTTKPEFYSQYKAARMILGSSSRTISVMATAVKNGTNAPLHNVLFSFISKKDNTVAVVKKTTEKGHFSLKHLPEGNYDIRVQKTGFKEQTISVTVIGGELTNINVVMEAA